MNPGASYPPRAPGTHTYNETDDRWRTALHEASHACVAVAVGADVNLVSIRPGQRHAGITFPEYPRWIGDAAAAAAVPGPFVPAELRRSIEMEMVVALAGDHGERLAPPPPGAYRPESECVTGADTLARDLAELSPRHVELLLAAEAQTEGVLTDIEVATRRAGGMGRDMERATHVAYMREVAATLVRHAQPEILSVAEELYRREVLNGDEVRAARRAAYPPIKRGASA